MNGELG